GTTGQPKGVMIEQRSVVRLLFNDDNLFDFDENDVWTMFHSYFFDFSVWEMYGSLLYGGKLVIVSNTVAKDLSLFADLLESHKVSVLNHTPSAFYNLSEECIKTERDFALRYIIFGGEALQLSKLKGWKLKYPQTKLINMYGITETTVHATYKNITLKEIEEGLGNIGRAIPTLGCYILDENRQLVPVGVKGEICISGAGVARGYLNKAELTKSRFIKNPYAGGEYLYCSGDLGRVLETGDLEYLGRKDHQVKIRGYRIELGEIESNLSGFSPSIGQVVAEAKELNGDKVLVAYYTLAESADLNKTDLREYLQGKLPEYMVPGFFVELESIPLTSNGKIDRLSLPGVTGEDLIRGEYVAPRTDTDRKLVGIWQEVLGLERIGITDNFFELGGHSLLIFKVMQSVNEEFNINISVKQFFEHNTIKEIAEVINELILINSLSANDYEGAESERFTI
ncbi:non-ribosomal peptide synthetase, partial [Chryseobacterium sp. G0240]|uniref:non-ribosomal peptide synthetase n=1 Tax=Chryseobacterium sp. G0240 TaxID=2487066 RepID=UPI000F9CC4E8